MQIKIINKAFELHSKGNILEAARYYQSFIDKGFKDYRVFTNYGTILEGLGQLEKAANLFRKAIELKPNYEIAYSNLGNVLRGLGQLKESEFASHKAIQLNPNFANAYSNVANVLKYIVECGRVRGGSVLRAHRRETRLTVYSAHSVVKLKSKMIPRCYGIQKLD